MLCLQHSSSNQDAEKQADKEAEAKLKEIKQIGNKTGDKVVKDLMTAVVDVKPVVPDRVEAPAA